MAKVDARRVAALLDEPGGMRGVVLFGDDAGLVRERAERAVRAVLGGAMDDPFRLVELTREEALRPGRLAGEMAALAMTGGRRVVRLREATDAHVAVLKEALAEPGEALAVLEAGELTPRSRLRAWAEGEPAIGAVACYRERPEELSGSIGRMLREAGVEVEPAALAWLAGRLGEDRMLTRREVEKLALYVGPGGRVDEEAALACAGEGSAPDLDEALMAATAGEPAVADRALDLAFAESASPVAVLRAALRHVGRLHEAVAAGGNPEVLRPPVFFRHKRRFEAALRLWSSPMLEAAGVQLLEAEARVKSSAFRDSDAVLARAAVMALARQAGARAGRTGRG